MEVAQGVVLWRNPLNDFVVVQIHYSADVKRRGGWKFKASKKYGGLRSWKWRMEMEIDWDAVKGSLVFEMWEDRVHVIRPFDPPAHWPRWIMIDPGWRNPTSALWVAVDVDSEPDEFGQRPVHVYREFYKPRHTAAFIAQVASDWSKTALDDDGAPSWEWIEAVVLDPQAKQEHQGAQAGEDVPEVAETFLTRFVAKMDEIGWDVPIDTGNNLKANAIEEIITRLGNFWMDAAGVPLYDASNNFREPTLDEIAAGASYKRPTLFVHKGCKAVAEEMKKYRFGDWSEGQVAERHNQQEKPLDKDDHSVTNLIRFVNLLATLREEDGVDLSTFSSRPRPKRWLTDDEVVAERHRKLPQRKRKRS